jgi:hypothetical protein
MQRTVRTVPVGTAQRHFSTIRDVPSSGPEIKARQFLFLQDVVNNGIFQGLMNCGPIQFDTMRMRHDGESWVIEMEAIEE